MSNITLFSKGLISLILQHDLNYTISKECKIIHITDKLKIIQIKEIVICSILQYFQRFNFIDITARLKISYFKGM